MAAQRNNLVQVPSIAPYTTDAASLHVMITAWEQVPSSRNRIADPGLWPVNISQVVSEDTARARWKCFDAAHALTARNFRGETLSRGATASAPAPLSGAREPDDDALAQSRPVLVTQPCNV